MTGTSTRLLLLLAASFLCICVAADGVVTGDSGAAKSPRKLLQFEDDDFIVTPKAFADRFRLGTADAFADSVAEAVTKRGAEAVGTAMAAAIAQGGAASEGLARATATAICKGGATVRAFAEAWTVTIDKRPDGCTVLKEAHAKALAECKNGVARAAASSEVLVTLLGTCKIGSGPPSSSADDFDPTDNEFGSLING